MIRISLAVAVLLFTLASSRLSAQLTFPLLRPGGIDAAVHVNDVAEGSEAIWFGSQDGLYVSRDGYSLQKSGSSREPISCLVHTGSELLIGSPEGVFRLDESTSPVTLKAVGGNWGGHSIVSMLSNGNGTALIETDLNVFYYEDGTVSEFPLSSLLGVDRKNRVWASNENGLLRFENGAFTLIDASIGELPTPTMVDTGGELYFIIETNRRDSFTPYLFQEDIDSLEALGLQDFPLLGVGAVDRVLWVSINGDPHRLIGSEDYVRVSGELSDIRMIEVAEDFVVLVSKERVFASPIGTEDFFVVAEDRRIFGKVNSATLTSKGLLLWGERGVIRFDETSRVRIDDNIFLLPLVSTGLIFDDKIWIGGAEYKGIRRRHDISRRDDFQFIIAGSVQSRDAKKAKYEYTDLADSSPYEVARAFGDVYISVRDHYSNIWDVDRIRLVKITGFTGVPFWTLFWVSLILIFLPITVITLLSTPVLPLRFRFLLYATLTVVLSMAPKIFKKVYFFSFRRMRLALRGIYVDMWRKKYAVDEHKDSEKFLPWDKTVSWISTSVNSAIRRIRSRNQPAKTSEVSSGSDPICRSSELASVVAKLRKETVLDLSVEKCAALRLEHIAYEISKKRYGDGWLWETIPVLCHFEHLPRIDYAEMVKMIEDSVVRALDSEIWFFNREFCEELLLHFNCVFLFYYDAGNSFVAGAMRHFFRNSGRSNCMVLHSAP